MSPVKEILIGMRVADLLPGCSPGDGVVSCRLCGADVVCILCSPTPAELDGVEHTCARCYARSVRVLGCIDLMPPLSTRMVQLFNEMIGTDLDEKQVRRALWNLILDLEYGRSPDAAMYYLAVADPSWSLPTNTKMCQEMTMDAPDLTMKIVGPRHWHASCGGKQFCGNPNTLIKFVVDAIAAIDPGVVGASGLGRVVTVAVALDAVQDLTSGLAANASPSKAATAPEEEANTEGLSIEEIFRRAVEGE